MEEKKHEASRKYLYYENDAGGVAQTAKKHYHDAFEIYFLESGECHYFIDDKSYRVQVGDVILIPKGIIHKTAYENGKRSRRLIYCSHHFIPTAVISLLPSIRYHYRNPQVVDEIRGIFDRIEQEYTRPDEFSEDAILHYVHLLFFLLARNRSQTNAIKQNSTYTTEAIAYIKEHYRTPIRLSELAKRYSISAEHLSRVFKSETGLGFNQYLTMIRLQKAEAMLKNSPSIPITEVAFACGFNDGNYFSYKFKQAYGISPSTARRQAE